MAGVGKSYAGQHIADELEYTCVEVDDLIEKEAQKRGIDENTLSDEAFVELEECVILSLKDMEGCVFVTGGSVVYSEEAMKLLKSMSKVIYLEDSLDNIKERFDIRESQNPGKIVGLGEKSFEELFEERMLLYIRHADAIVNVSQHRDPGELAKEVARRFPKEENMAMHENPELKHPDHRTIR